MLLAGGLFLVLDRSMHDAVAVAAVVAVAAAVTAADGNLVDNGWEMMTDDNVGRRRQRTREAG